MKLLIFDSYDSFTYNLVHLVRSLGCTDVDVARNDRIALDDIAPYDRIILSPGPGIPAEAGLLLPLIRRYAGQKPILGVCLGHQAIGEAFGAQLENLRNVFHGVATTVRLVADDPLLAGLPAAFDAGRYHSWVVRRDSLPPSLRITAKDDEGYIMAMRHATWPLHGVQFHPESVLTPLGARIVENFLSL